MNETVLNDFASSGLLLSPVVKIHTIWNDRGFNWGFVFVYDPLVAAAHRNLRRAPWHTETTKAHLNNY